ncbi:MAG: gliding motility-associated C-terminal domain-containing protein, partial [Bacteroidia bacterium]|nr:gliding motility-associated C-terminal domain-containing protein [Bacteroidia bacterium]
ANAGDTSLWNGKGNPDISVASWITAWNLESPGFASNVSSGGGRGGYTYSNSNKDPIVFGPNDYTNWGGDGRSNNGGIGGRPLDYASGRVFLGGGGGGGDSDNGYGGRGGSGGGIIFILNYGQIIANGLITANGRDGYNTSTPTPGVNDLTGRDGAGGAGGGGAIIIKTPNPIIGTPTVTAKGGNGGNQQMRSGYIFGSPNDAYGPGGGGGGGYIGSNVSVPNTNVSGGNNGIVQYLSGSNGCLIDNNFPPNGATKGGTGIVTNTLTPPHIITVNPSTISVCVGIAVSATAVSTNTSSTIFWYSNFTGTTSISSGSVISVTYTTPGTYSLYAGTCPGILRAPLIITVTPTPTISVNSSTICSGQSATLIASGASSYTWNTGSNSNSIIVTPSSNTNYTVSGGSAGCTDTKTTQVIVSPTPTISVNSSTICSGQSATLIASGASSYTWNTGSNSNSIIVTPSSNTNYTVSGGSAGCTDTKTTQVIVSPTPTISVNSSTICSGQSATLIASGASSYTWNTGSNSNSIIVTPSSNTNYTVSGGSAGCTDTKTTQVIVSPTPTISVNSSTICSGQSATLIASGASSYTWNTGALTNSIIVFPSANTNYTVIGQNNFCISSETANVIVQTAPSLTLIPSSSLVCKDACVTISFLPLTYTNVQYDYGYGFMPVALMCYTSTGTYTVRGTGTYTNGCTYTTSPITLNVVNNPIAAFDMPSEAFIGESITISNNSIGGQLFNWSFGDGNTANTYSYSMSHSYYSSGQYCVLLTVIDTTSLCHDTASKCIIIQDNFEIEIPNVFTPNADGTNDVFIVRAKGIKDFYGQIYDRWGLLLYEWKDINTGWNGYMKNNAKAPTGTYFYQIQCTLINGDKKEFKGYITLLE